MHFWPIVTLPNLFETRLEYWGKHFTQSTPPPQAHGVKVPSSAYATSLNVGGVGRPVPGRPAHPVDAAAAELLEVEAGERWQHAARPRRVGPVPGALERVLPASSSSSPSTFLSSAGPVVKHDAAVGVLPVLVVVVVVAAVAAVVLVVVVVVVAIEVGGAGPGARQEHLPVLLRRSRRRRRGGRAGPAAREEELPVLLRHAHLAAVSCFAAAAARAVRRRRRFERVVADGRLLRQVRRRAVGGRRGRGRAERRRRIVSLVVVVLLLVVLVVLLQVGWES